MIPKYYSPRKNILKSQKKLKFYHKKTKKKGLSLYFFNPERNKKIKQEKVELFYKHPVDNYLIISENHNLNIFKNINKYNLFVLSFKKIHFPFLPKLIPRFPILYDNYFIFNQYHLKEINGIYEHPHLFLTLSDLICRIKKNFGTLMSNQSIHNSLQIYNYKISTDFDRVKKGGYKDYYTNIIQKQDFVTHCYNQFPGVPTNLNGWFSPNNMIILDFVFKKYNLRNIAELGVWYGKSTQFMLQKTQANIYSVDNFQHPFISSYIADGNDIMDTFYFKYIRHDTFLSNFKNYQNLYLVKYNAFYSPELFKRVKLQIDLFYIDFLKKKDDLIEFILKIKKIFPKTLIIGDDYIIGSVRKAIEYLQKKMTIYTFGTCYFIPPFSINKLDLDNFFEQHPQTKKKVLIKNNLENLNTNDQFLLETAQRLLKRNFRDFFNYVKRYQLDLNQIDEGLIFKGTLYMEFYHSYKEHPNLTQYEQILYQYQQPDEKKNLRELTALDYRNHDICLD